MAVDHRNDDIFSKSSNEKTQIKVVDIIVGDLSNELKERMKQKSLMILQKPWVCIQFVPFLKGLNMIL